jgi:hypothetical protein
MIRFQFAPMLHEGSRLADESTSGMTSADARES